MPKVLSFFGSSWFFFFHEKKNTLVHKLQTQNSLLVSDWINLTGLKATTGNRYATSKAFLSFWNWGSFDNVKDFFLYNLGPVQWRLTCYWLTTGRFQIYVAGDLASKFMKCPKCSHLFFLHQCKIGFSKSREKLFTGANRKTRKTLCFRDNSKNIFVFFQRENARLLVAFANNVVWITGRVPTRSNQFLRAIVLYVWVF